jgi:hypothetical protein
MGMTSLVCGGELSARRGPRPRRYCSRACQARAYLERNPQQPTVTRLLAGYDGVSSREFADRLTLAGLWQADALDAGLSVGDADLDTVTRLPAVLAARARQGVPNEKAALFQITNRPQDSETKASRDDRGRAEEPPACTPDPMSERAKPLKGETA